MAIKLKRPAQTKISNITYNNIIQDVYNLIQDNNEMKDNWSDYISSDAGRMMTELFAWISERLAERIDSVGNELFLETAESKESVLRILKLVGYKLPFPTSASVPCKIYVSAASAGTNYTEDVLTLSYGVESNNSIYLNSNSFKSFVHAPSGRIFELIKYDESIKKYDYFMPVSISAKNVNDNVILQEGVTKSQNFEINRLGHFTIPLNGSVIRDSVAVFSTEKKYNKFVELKKVDNFFNSDAQRADSPVYKVNNLGDGKCELEFPNTEIGLKVRTEIGDSYTVLYRVGGGTAGNIVSGSLKTVETILLNNGRTRGTINLENTKNGIGGEDEPTVDQIRTQAPQDVRNYTSAVTAEDYEYILKRNNASLIDVKIYGENNITSEEIEDVYGAYSNPLDVWIFAIKQSPLLDRETSATLTEYINDISFETFDLNERLNEIYQFRLADLNVKIDTSKLFPNNVPKTVEGREITGETEAQDKIIHNPITIQSTDRVKEKMNGALETDKFKVILTEVNFEEQKVDIKPNSSNKKYYIEDSVDLGDDEEIENKKRYLDTETDIIIEEVFPEFSSIWGNKDFNTQSGDSLELDIGGDSVNISFNKDVLSPDRIVEQANNAISYEKNSNLQGVILRDDIYNLDEKIVTELTEGSTVYFYLKPEIDDDVLCSFTYGNDPISDFTWNDLVVKLNVSLSEEFPSDEYFAALIEKNVGTELACHTFVIYNTASGLSNSRFSIEDDITKTFLSGLLSEQEEELFSSPLFYQTKQKCELTINSIPTISGSITVGDVEIEVYDTEVPTTDDVALLIETAFIDHLVWEATISQENASIVVFEALGYGEKEGITFEDSSSSPTGITAEVVIDSQDEEIVPIIDFLFFDNESGEVSIKGEKGSYIIIKNTRFFKELFGLSDGDFENGTDFYISGERILTFDSDRNYVVGMRTIKSKLPSVLFVSAFWDTEQEIELGSYYVNIKENPNIPVEVSPLLERPLIKRLYNTVFKQIGRETVSNYPDLYNSKYNLKFTRKKVSNSTFNQIGEGKNPPSLAFNSKTIADNLNSSDVLKLRINGKDLIPTGDNFVEGISTSLYVNGETINDCVVYSSNGYLTVFLSLLKNKSSKDVADAIVAKFFPNDLIVLTDDSTKNPYFQTVENNYTSSIDITETPISTFKEIFYGEFEPIISADTSKIGVIPIEYKKIVFSKLNHVNNKDVEITFTSNGSPKMYTISTGTSFENFKINVGSKFDNITEMTFNGEELVFLPRFNGYKFKISVMVKDEGIGEDEQEERFKNENTAKLFIPSLKEIASLNGFIQYEQENLGDYYIEFENDKYMLKVEDVEKFPYGDVYIHMIEDYRKDHIISRNIENSDITYTDEHNWNQSIISKKMICVEHIYKQPIFVPFDLEIKATLLREAGLSKEEIYKEEIEEELRSIYNIYDSKIGENIDKNIISVLIQNNINYVKNVFVKYLGPDLETGIRNTSTLEMNFNEKGILATNNRETSTDGLEETIKYLHGIKIDLEYER